MKIRHVVLTVVVVAGISLASMAQKQASTVKVYLLKAGGETIAELHVKNTGNVMLKSASSNGGMEYDPNSGTFVATGGVTLKLTDGTNSISVQADEVQSLPQSN